MPDLSLVMPYYRNPRMLHRHLLVWRHEWSPELRDRVEVVIVDDGSPNETAIEAMAAMWGGDHAGLPPIEVYRVKEDRKWHQHGARNLGAHVAKAATIFMTDMDHIVPPSTLAEVLRALPLKPQEVLTFGRVDAPPTLTWRAMDWPEFARTLNKDGERKPHVNSFALARTHYWLLGGYDESYCGIYGTDQEFRSRLFGPRTPVRHLDHAPLIRVDRSVIPDASTRDVERKTPDRSTAKRRVAAAKQMRGEHGPRSLQFEWERVAI